MSYRPPAARIDAYLWWSIFKNTQVYLRTSRIDTERIVDWAMSQLCLGGSLIPRILIGDNVSPASQACISMERMVRLICRIEKKYSLLRRAILTLQIA